MLGTFACARFRFVLSVTTPLRLSAIAGATLRRGFGHVFKRRVCLWPPGECARCLLKNTCSYPYIFETAPPPGATKLRALEQIPRPFVLEAAEGEPGRRYEPGERLEFRLVLALCDRWGCPRLPKVVDRIVERIMRERPDIGAAPNRN